MLGDRIHVGVPSQATSPVGLSALHWGLLGILFMNGCKVYATTAILSINLAILQKNILTLTPDALANSG